MHEPRILIVEDETIVALELEDRLRRQGYAIAGVERSFEEALARLDHVQIDLALLDVRLTRPRDGIELAAELHKRDIPVVFLTAHGDEDTLAQVKAVGPQGYLLKPFDGRLLRLTIETALHRHAAERARLEAERARRRAEAFQAAILEQSPDAILVLTPKGEIELANRVARRLFGLELDGPVSVNIEASLLELDVARLRASAGSPVHTTAHARNGAQFPAEVTVGVVPIADGERLIVAVRDLTERQQFEQQLARAHRLEVAGRVASGIAHDLNSLLSVVGITSFLLTDASAEQMPELLGDLGDAVELGAALTTRLLSIARQRSGEARDVAVNEQLRGVERLVRRVLRTNIRVDFELASNAGAVRINPTQLDQVILNLVINADRAMPEGGRLTIRSGCRQLEGVPYSFIDVEDTGYGMSEALQCRVFEPFFSTRSESGGTGLGLSIVKDIVTAAGGSIRLESQVDVGTRFTIELPCVAHVDSVSEHQLAAELSKSLGKGRAVLLVDDDPSHLRAVTRLLQSWGFHPVPAHGPGEAMLMVERSRDDFAFALVDIEMPYMDGIELSERLNRLRHDLPVLLVSGAAQAGEHATLGKPLRPEQLAAAIDRALYPTREETP